MEHEGSKEPVNGPYPEPVESSSQQHSGFQNPL